MISNIKINEMVKAGKITEALKAIESNAREEMQNMSAMSRTEKSAVNRLIKLSSATWNQALRKAHTFTFNYETYYGITDGHYILSCTNDMGIDVAEEHERLSVFEKFFDSVYDSDMVTVQIDKCDLTRFIKSKAHKNGTKTYHPYAFYYLNTIVGVNPEYLLDCLSFCDTDTITFKKPSSECLKTPIFITSGNKSHMAAILPINTNKQAIEYMVNWRYTFES